MSRKHIAVIGAGASGLMAAAAAAGEGARVTVLEKNEKAGKKIYITGKGRCNLTNTCETADFFDHVVRNPKFLYSAVYGFDASMVMDFMEENGCRVKTERGGRVFPVTDHASDVTKALLHALDLPDVRIRYHAPVQEIITKDGRAAGVLMRSGEFLEADAVILCTGGLSYPSTGSTGDGYRMAGALGIPVREQAPSLVPLCVRETWCRGLQGLALKNVRLTLRAPRAEGKKKSKKDVLYSGFGEMLFTHWGISGPLVLTASCYADFGAADTYLLEIDLKPYMSQEELEERLAREFRGEAERRKQLKSALRSLLPAGLARETAVLSGLGEDRVVSSVTDKEITALASLMKAVPLHAVGTRGFAEAVITKGGLDVRAFDPSTMECRAIRGLYAAGEVLDVDAHTGGYNLQIAWSTGHLAGLCAAAGQ